MKYFIIYFYDGQKYIKILSEDFTLHVTKSSIKLVNNNKADYFLLGEIRSYELVNELKSTENIKLVEE